MNKKPYLLISASIFGVIAVVHLVRVLLRIPVNVGELRLPMGFSWGGLVLAALLSVWGFLLAKDRGRKSSLR